MEQEIVFKSSVDNVFNGIKIEVGELIPIDKVIKKDLLKEMYNPKTCVYLASMPLISFLGSKHVYPAHFYKDSDKHTICVYIRDDFEMRRLVTLWDEGFFDDLKLFNKQFGKTKKAFFTGNISDMKGF